MTSQLAQCNCGLLLLGNLKVTCYWLCKVDFLVLLVCLGALENLFDFDGIGFVSLLSQQLGRRGQEHGRCMDCLGYRWHSRLASTT